MCFSHIFSINPQTRNGYKVFVKRAKQRTRMYSPIAGSLYSITKNKIIMGKNLEHSILWNKSLLLGWTVTWDGFIHGAITVFINKKDAINFAKIASRQSPENYHAVVYRIYGKHEMSGEWLFPGKLYKMATINVEKFRIGKLIYTARK